MNLPEFPAVMGIINLSPDSFYQPTSYFDAALKKADKMVSEGASIIDVGAIATNPTVDLSKAVSLQTELDAIIPFIEQLSRSVEVMISVDTTRADVMRESIQAGAHMINDQCALRGENTLETAKALQVPVCLMHHFRPARIPDSTTQEMLLHQIQHDLLHEINRCLQSGIAPKNIIIDPGFGGGHFGKSINENFFILNKLHVFTELGFPVLAGMSRKSMFSEIQPKVSDRLYASVAAATIAAMQGAAILRVHDVQATVDAIRVVKKSKGCVA